MPVYTPYQIVINSISGAIGLSGSAGAVGPAGPSGSLQWKGGATTLDFGVAPGDTTATVTIPGQTAILTSSIVSVWIPYSGSIDHSADEHLVEQITVMAGNIILNTSFDIMAYANNGPVVGKFNVNWRWVV